MKSEDITDAEIQGIASYIILAHTEDIEYLSVVEMTDDQLEIDSSELDEFARAEQEKIWRRVDAMIGKATVIVEFQE